MCFVCFRFYLEKKRERREEKMSSYTALNNEEDKIHWKPGQQYEDGSTILMVERITGKTFFFFFFSLFLCLFLCFFVSLFSLFLCFFVSLFLCFFCFFVSLSFLHSSFFFFFFFSFSSNNPFSKQREPPRLLKIKDFVH